MNKPLKKSIALYTGVVGALLISKNVNAQVVYTDVNPDTLVDVFVQPYLLDFDNNNDTDFRLNSHEMYLSSSGGSGGVSIYLAGFFPITWAHSAGNYVLGGVQANCIIPDLAAMQPVNMSISGTLSGWQRWSTIEYSGFCNGGWPLNNFHYVGLKFYINSLPHFGWIRIKAINSHQFLIADYAYELQSNTVISTGQTSSVGFSENFKDFNFTQNENNFIINLSGLYDEENHLSVKNILGQEIMNRSFSGNTCNFTINDKGIFIIEVIDGKNTFSKKVFVY